MRLSVSARRSLRQHPPTIIIIFRVHFTQRLCVIHMDGVETESCEWCSVKGQGLHRICDRCVLDKLNFKQDVGKKWMGLQTCVRCHHTWYPRKAQRPYTCPSCRSGPPGRGIFAWFECCRAIFGWVLVVSGCLSCFSTNLKAVSLVSYQRYLRSHINVIKTTSVHTLVISAQQ